MRSPDGPEDDDLPPPPELCIICGFGFGPDCDDVLGQIIPTDKQRVELIDGPAHFYCLNKAIENSKRG